MSKNKVKLSLTLSANDAAQMAALSKFALALSQSASASNESPDLKNSNTPEIPEEKSVYLGVPEDVTPKNQAQATEGATQATQRKRRTQAEIKAEREAAEQVSEVEQAESEPAEVDSEQEAEAPKSPAPSKITLDDVRRMIAEKKEKHLQIMKFKLQQDFGVSKAPDLKPDQYEAYYNFLTSLD